MLKFALLFCGVFCLAQEQDAMPWNDSYSLTWADFKDQPDKKERAVAITASGITFGYSIKQADKQVISFTTTVVAHFYPEQSWHKLEADAQVLQHEQLHFDITELYARKFRQRISKLKISNNIGDQLKQMHLAINKELAAMQDVYDIETDFSRNAKEQARWKVEIAYQLTTLSKFKSVD